MVTISSGSEVGLNLWRCAVVCVLLSGVSLVNGGFLVLGPCASGGLDSDRVPFLSAEREGRVPTL